MADQVSSFLRGLSPRRKVARYPAIVPPVLCAGIALSLLAAGIIHGWEQKAAAQAAADLVQEQAENLRIKMMRSMEVLYSIASLYQAKGEIDRAEFHKFVQQALERQPELRALSWNPRVPVYRRATLESAAVDAGLTGFQFRELDAAGQLTRAGSRAEYVPVYYIEPLEGNAAALGFDLGSDASRRQSLEAARDAGTPFATTSIRLTQETNHPPGLLVLLPIYPGSTPTTLAQRREKLAGFAVAVFRVADLVGDAFRLLEARGLQANLVDVGASTPQLIYAGANKGRRVARGTFTDHADLEIAGRKWSIHFSPTPVFHATSANGQSLIVLVAGLALTLLLVAHLYGSWRRTQEIAAANGALQEEIRMRQKAQAAAAAANEAKSDFLASMSHEIRTPLNAILGYTQLMRHDGGMNEEQRDAIGGINASGRHLLGLINEILDLSKIEAGRMELHPIDFDLPALGRSLLATFQPLCAQKRIKFRLHIDPAASPRVRGDEGKVRQVLINLLGNAVKFTQAGEVCLRIKTERASGWLFEVIDTGLGIPENEQEEIFKPFHQGTTAAHQGGTGLGLAIAQKQVDLLGGELKLQSERGIGSRFYFTIPLPGSVEAEVAPNRYLEPIYLKTGTEVRALVVDDRRENREVLAGMLRRVGCKVALAGNGLEAVRECSTFQPHLVFMDLLMPGMDGLETAREILSQPGTPPRIVAQSAAELSNHRARAQAAGCVDFLPKPICADQVYECLRVQLGVEFEAAGPELQMSQADSIGLQEAGPAILPEALCARLNLAAELHSTTALKACLRELRELGPEGQSLAENVRHLMRSYDMDGILRLVSTVNSPALMIQANHSPDGTQPSPS